MESAIWLPKGTRPPPDKRQSGFSEEFGHQTYVCPDARRASSVKDFCCVLMSDWTQAHNEDSSPSSEFSLSRCRRGPGGWGRENAHGRAYCTNLTMRTKNRCTGGWWVGQLRNSGLLRGARDVALRRRRTAGGRLQQVATTTDKPSWYLPSFAPLHASHVKKPKAGKD
jgi:hypothetical protein